MMTAIIVSAAAVAFAAVMTSPVLASRPALRQRIVESLVQPAPPRGGDGLVVVKSWNRLYLFRQGRIERRYDVATGANPVFTPEGVFTVANRTDSPGDAAYGPRWLGLAVPYEADLRQRLGYGRGAADGGGQATGGTDPRAPAGHKYGIHGTDKPWSIGSCASAGCVRMRNQDIVELYDLVPVGTVVEIRP